jgi:hypothetical protein
MISHYNMITKHNMFQTKGLLNVANISLNYKLIKIWLSLPQRLRRNLRCSLDVGWDRWWGSCGSMALHRDVEFWLPSSSAPARWLGARSLRSCASIFLLSNTACSKLLNTWQLYDGSPSVPLSRIKSYTTLSSTRTVGPTSNKYDILSLHHLVSPPST